MKHYLTIAVLLLSTSAMAQDIPPQPPTASPDASSPVVAPIPTPQPKPAIGPQQPVEHLFYFEVTQTEVQQIGQALNELPKRIADGLILKLNAELQLQAKIAEQYAKVTTPPVKDADEKPVHRRIRR